MRTQKKQEKNNGCFIELVGCSAEFGTLYLDVVVNVSTQFVDFFHNECIGSPNDR